MTCHIYTHKETSHISSPREGSLTGLKIVVQPNMSVTGWPTNAGSRALNGYVALEDATVVKRLRSGGATLVGSARMSELGFGLGGDTLAEACSGDEVTVGLITDTMGEARIASAVSGMFGYKPSFGIISRLGMIGLIPSMESCGIVGKHLENVIAVAEVIAGFDENDFSMADEPLPDLGESMKSLRIPSTVGVIEECHRMLNESEKNAFKAGITKLKDKGFKIKELSFENFELFRAVHNVIGSVEASSSSGKYDGVRYGHRAASDKNWNDMYLKTRGESFGTLIKSYLFQGAYFQFENYPSFEDACRIRGGLVRKMSRLLETVDVIALPTRRLMFDATNATTIAETYEAFSFTVPANVTGQPSLSIPRFASDSTGDVGLQILGEHKSDVRLLALGMELSSIVKGV